MSDRIPCKNDGCNKTILPATAKKTGGICMPCFQSIKRKEEEEYIRKNRRDVNLYEWITSPVEILKIMYTPKEHSPLINYIKYPRSKEEIYASLLPDEINELEGYAIQLIKNNCIDTAEDVLLRLVCQSNACIDKCLEALIGKNHYYPGIIFKGSSKKIRDHLISAVKLDSENRNHILHALAWIGDQEVVKLFNEWRQSPPTWSNQLYVKPESYSFEAGWKLTEDGEREDLFYNECYPFEEREYTDKEVVQIIKRHDNKCPWCKTPLTVLFDFDLSNPMLGFLNIQGKRLRIATCHICSCYGFIYSKFDTSGSSTWYEFNERPSYLPDIAEPEEESFNVTKTLALSSEKRDKYYASSWILETSESQIAGHPTWIHDAEYPNCPECAKNMKFIGQLACEDFEENGEGIYYAFICEECSIAATHYQQT